MKPEEIIPPITDKIPSDRSELRKIIEKYEIDEELTSENAIFLEDSDTAIKLRGSQLDIEEGQEILKMEIQTPRHQVYMKVTGVFVSNVMIKLDGYDKYESYEIFPG